MTVVGLLHPGEMGSAVGSAFVAAGHTVLWASEGGATRLALVPSPSRTCGRPLRSPHAARSSSVVPPHAAGDVARQFSSYDDIYVDANAIAPDTAPGLAPPRFVDGGIIGGPPAPRLYLSGDEAEDVAALFAGSPIEARVVSNASALKCAFAGWTKGSAALKLAVREYARRSGIEDALPGELDVDVNDANVASKAWRWVGEMDEIANAFADEDLPPGFHEAAAEIYRSVDSEPSIEVTDKAPRC